MKFIGINGGAFDPIHYGHLHPALEVKQQLDLDKVLFIPYYQPVHKANPMVSAQVRCLMIEKAIEKLPNIILETIEIDNAKPSYMVDTLRSLKQKLTNDNLVLMMGTDAFAKFHTWHDWQGILKIANIVIMHRPAGSLPTNCESGQIYKKYKVKSLTSSSGQIIDLAVTQFDISSTLVRARFKDSDSVAHLLPPSVTAIIKKYGLYKG